MIINPEETIELKNERKREYLELKNEKIRKYNEIENEQKRKHNEIEKEKYIKEIQARLKKIKVIKTIALFWMLFVFIVEIICILEDITIFFACLFGFFIWGVFPYVIIKWIYKATEKQIKRLD